MLVVLVAGASTRAEPPRTFSVPIEIQGLDHDLAFVPVSATVDFSAWLAELSVNGAVDERSIRLHRVGKNGKVVEVPVQFISALQPRSTGRQILPDRPVGISDLAEFRAGETPPGIKVAGTLAWVASGDVPRYRLDFSVPLEGMAVQVPYPPYNLRHFDAEGRATKVQTPARMRIRPQRPLRGVVRLQDGDSVVTAYHLGPIDERSTPRRSFLFPVLGPDGDSLTGFGKPHDPTGSHDHHHSLWIAHAAVDGCDFWSEKGGAIIHESLEESEDGPVFARLVQRARWSLDGSPRLRERRTLTLHRTPAGFRAIDIGLEWNPPGETPVALGKTTFGPLAARVDASLSVFDGGGEIQDARGRRNERAVHLKRSEWIDQSGPVGPDGWGGVALLDHPDNPNHPTTWHCRNDGWAGVALCADGPLTIEPGRPLRLRYRVILHRGDAVSGEIPRRWAEFAARPTIVLGRPGPFQDRR